MIFTIDYLAKLHEFLMYKRLKILEQQTRCVRIGNNYSHFCLSNRLRASHHAKVIELMAEISALQEIMRRREEEIEEERKSVEQTHSEMVIMTLHI